MIIKNCTITKNDAYVIAPYIISASDPNYELYKGYNPGIDIRGNFIYAPSDCKCCYINLGDHSYSAIFEVDSCNFIRIENIASLKVRVSQKIHAGDLIGLSAMNKIHVEHVTPKPSKWPVRIYDADYYKNDPTDLLTSGIQSSVSYYNELVSSLDELSPDSDQDMMCFPMYSYEESSDGRGID